MVSEKPRGDAKDVAGATVEAWAGVNTSRRPASSAIAVSGGNH